MREKVLCGCAIWPFGFLQSVNQSNQLLGRMGECNIVVLALSPLLGKISDEGRIPKADIYGLEGCFLNDGVFSQNPLAGKLLAILSAPQNKENLLNGENTSKFNDDAVVVCPYCGGTHIVKKGFSDDHVTRRYVCRSCGKSFRRTTNSVISNTHKSAEVLEQFILLTLKGASLEACSRRCKIAIGTAFAWRHNILAAMAQDQTARMMKSSSTLRLVNTSIMRFTSSSERTVR